MNLDSIKTAIASQERRVARLERDHKVQARRLDELRNLQQLLLKPKKKEA